MATRRARHLDMHACKLWNLLGEPTGIIDWARGHILFAKHAVLDGDAVIILTEGGRLVNNTRTVICGHVRVVQHAERLVLELRKCSVCDRVSKIFFTRTCSVKYSKRGTYLHPFISEPLKVATFLNFAFFGSL